MESSPQHASSPARSGPLALLVATRKGAFFLRSADRREWAIDGPHFLGHIVNHAVLDPRDRRTLLLAARTGHLGPTIFRSQDLGRSWKEASRPPAFPKRAPEAVLAGKPPHWQRAGRRQFEPLAGAGPEPPPQSAQGRVVDYTFWLAPGHASEPGVWYAGTSPEGLFRSEDGGERWEPVAGFNEHPMYPQWAGDPQGGTPDGAVVHSILVDPRDPRHLYVSLSSAGGGVLESSDGGGDWKPLNAGCRADFLPDPFPEIGHDPHCVLLHPLAPDLLYQQNHCGIYRMERSAGRWVRIGENMPKEVGDIGFPIVLHPRDPRTAWVFPMDGTEVWPRTSPGGRPAVFATRDAGESWRRLDHGLPREQAWLTVLRQAMTGDEHDPVGIYFGTTCGEVWGSADEGEEWSCLASHLPHVYAVEAAELEA
jgi:photosystem II stability/assembly factor-like uncharacterized protein